MYAVYYANSFKRNVKLCKKRGLNLKLLEDVVDMLRKEGTLPRKYHQHQLSGKYAGLWEAHIQPDWLIVWQQDDRELYLIFTYTGTHSDLF